MLIDRIELEWNLQLEASMHLGSGTAIRGERRERDGTVEEEEIAQLLADAKGVPCLPGSALKGALRARCVDDDWRRDAFGAIGDREEGLIGRLMVFMAYLATPGPTGLLPKRSPDKGIFVRKRTAIDRRRGSAARNKLYAQECLAAGAVFKGRAVWSCDLGGDTAERAARQRKELDTLAATLAPLRNGLTLGRGGRHGEGRIRASEIRAFLHRFSETGEWDEPDDVSAELEAAIDKVIKTRAAEAPAVEAVITLRAEGPFLLADPDYEDDAEADDDEHIQLEALRWDVAAPALWSTSLLGALRTRAAWLIELDRLRKRQEGTRSPYVPEDRADDASVDDRWLEAVLGERRAVRALKDLDSLSAVERLFGVPGWQGLLQVQELEVIDPGQEQTLVNVAIDRLTGGALHEALFHTRAFVGVTLRVAISLPPGRGEFSVANSDRSLAKLLVDDLRTNGLVLGHGSSRGWGWFKAEAAGTKLRS